MRWVCQLWQILILENGPCGAEGEEVRHPQGLTGTVDTYIKANRASPSQAQSALEADLKRDL